MKLRKPQCEVTDQSFYRCVRHSGKCFYRLYWDRHLKPIHGYGSAGEDGTEMRALAAKHWRRLSEKPEAVNY